MSEFDDVIRDDKTHSTEPQVPEEDAQPKLDKKSLIEMLTDDGDLSEFGKQLNLDGDMTEKVLVPLVNFLDKYGVGETLSTNPTINSGVNLMSFVSDVAPILRSATEYFQGKKTELSTEDEAFLERIKEAQNFDSMSLFVGESVDEEEEEEVEAAEVIEAPPPKNPFTEGVNWNEMLGAKPNTSSQYGSIAESAPTTTGIITMESLAAESGLTMSQIENDRQSATNTGTAGSEVDYTQSKGLGDMVMGGMSEIQAAMQSEQNKIAAQSKVIFEGEKLATPDAISDYQPNTTPAPAEPTIGGLESLEDIMARQGIESFDTPEEEVEIFEEDEMEYISETNSYKNKNTGEEYEAISLTNIPDDYIELPVGNDPIDVDTLPPNAWLTETTETVDEVVVEESIEEPFFEIKDLTVEGLKIELKKLGLSTQGRKADLLNRLTETNNPSAADTWDNEGGAVVEGDDSEG